ncbi:class I SAM-dependent methyltransferase [Tsuneonella sp. YG55]|uniref:Class I SAM-dependent methyltransferase n=1 Tax=Tsuneonella litorea TaxID=2976475 RepID=A0A9X2W0K0_9SPHN|nr:class I SAM-dependent methyltransferase [Tsuneonella litorea]MCT2557801.1 class I SAM-dependent methyltransferase [Tsuneonella litorea]
MSATKFAEERLSGERFGFGDNWKDFLGLLDEDRVTQAEKSLVAMLGTDSLAGKRMIDIGSGSGLFSLAARRLGAEVHSIDFDPSSVWCTRSLRDRFFPDDAQWTVAEGSALDSDHLRTLGTFDVVYSWGVLHHTGEMWTGIQNAASMVRPSGLFYLAIYNDQGWKSHLWWLIKKFYNSLPGPLATAFAWTVGLAANAFNILKYTLKLKPMIAIRPLIDYRKQRGMNFSHDLIDWIGGFPFEFATYEALVHFLETAGFEHVRGTRATSLGCHEIVFRKSA